MARGALPLVTKDAVALDVLDQRILHQLVAHGRMPLTKLAKQLKISKERLHYRIKSLEKKGIIVEYRTRVMVQRLGMQYRVLCLRTSFSLEQKKKLVQKLKKNSAVTWIALTTGDWDLVLHLVTRDDDHCAATLEELLELTSAQQYSLLTSIRYFHGNNYYLPKGVKAIPRPKQMFPHGNVSLDDKQKKLLRALHDKPSATYAELATHCSLSGESVKRRMKQLLDEGVVDGFNASVNTPLLGCERYVLFLNVLRVPVKKVIEAIADHPHVIATFYTMGNFNYKVIIHPPNSLAFSQFVQHVKTLFGEHLVQTQLLMIDSQEYFTWLPDTF